MTLKIASINLSLALIFILMSIMTINIWKTEPVLTVQKESVSREKEKPSKMMTYRRYVPPENAFDDIVKQNMFSREREEFVPEVVDEPVIVEEKIKGKSISLFGVIMMDNFKKALISNPDRKKDSRPTIWVREGDQLANLKVTDILSDSIVFQDGVQKYKILMYEKDKDRMQNLPEKENTANVIVTEPNLKKEVSSPDRKTVTTDKTDIETVNTPFGTIQRRKK